MDIDYQVTDLDDTNVTVGALIFKSADATASLGTCIRNPTMIEGTATNLGLGIAANQVHRLTWNAGAQRLKGYTPEEVIGRHFSIFYDKADIANKKPERELDVAW